MKTKRSITLSTFTAITLVFVGLPIVTAAMMQPRIINVPAGGDLQAAINTAQPGDRIILEANKDYGCPGDLGCVLPVKSGSAFITIESSGYAGIPVRAFFSKRPTAEAVQLMARVRPSHFTQPVFTTAPGAHHYKLLGLDMAPLTGGQATRIVEFGTDGLAQDTLAEVPYALVIDKSWLHAADSTQSIQRGIALNSASTDITNSWITDIHGIGFDTQAICGWNGPGPYNITNNYLEASGENVMFGGARASIPGLVPTGINFQRNYLFKPLSWYVNDPSYAGIHWTVKNLFELKNARTAMVSGNVMENNWTDAQAGWGVQFTPRTSDSGPAAVIEDVQFVYNIVRNSGQGVNILGMDDPPQPQEVRLRRLRIAHNLFENINGPKFGSSGNLFTITNAADSVTIENNTGFHTGTIILSDYAPSTNFVYRNNISRHNTYGVFGSGAGTGNVTLQKYFPSAVFAGNVIAKEVLGPDSPSNIEAVYPAGNYFPASLQAIGFADMAGGNYRLLSTSPYKGKGTDGKDPGADLDALQAAQTAPQPIPTPTPTPMASPTPVPTPSPSPTATPVPSPTPRLREAGIFAWPSSRDLRKAEWQKRIAEGWTCVWPPQDGVLYCWR